MVPITGYDAHLIASQQLLKIEQFAVVVPEQQRSPLGFLLDAGAETFVLALDKNPRAHGQRKPCVFLLTLPGGGGRCGIYGIRPLVCQTYPAMLHHGSVAVRDDVICEKGSWNIAAMELPDWRLSLLRGEMENAIYRIVVAHWNQMVSEKPVSDHGCPDYFVYLMEVYRRIDDVRQAHANVMPQIVRQWGSQAHPAAGGSAAIRATSPSWQRFLTEVESMVLQASALSSG
jgi:Fe-S-cluster containining protein